jgi:DNA-binding IclR family transcriptional regulator
MQMLDMFETEHAELRLTDLSERLGISKPQALRMANTLEQGGYLARDPETKRYRLGIRLFMLGMAVQRQLDLRGVAQQFLRELAAHTNETVGLFVPDPAGPVCVDVIHTQHGLRVFAQEGRRMPWNAGTSAKVILAYLPEEERERILTTTRFQRFNTFTTTDPAELRAVLDRIRADGFHIGTQDLDLGSNGIAGPVFDHHGAIAGAIGLSAPVTRLTESRLPDYVQQVLEACQNTSQQLGYAGSPPDAGRLNVNAGAAAG